MRVKTRPSGVLKKFVYILIFLMGWNAPSEAQEVEVGVWMGMANYFGDLNPVFSFKEVRWAGGAFYRYNLNPRMAVRVGVNYARVKASDSKIEKVPYPQARNLSFESEILELGGAYEINFFKFQPKKDKFFTPYLMVGFSVFYYNPYTSVDGNKVYLQQVGTEGQNTPLGEENAYARYSFAIPFGGGIKYALNNNWSINVEISSRLSFTDYLDDVSRNYVDPGVLGSDLARYLHDRSLEPTAAVSGDSRSTPEFDEFVAGSITTIVGRDGQTYTVLNGYGQEFPDNWRGNDNDNDHYFVTSLKLSFILGGKFLRAKFR